MFFCRYALEGQTTAYFMSLLMHISCASSRATACPLPLQCTQQKLRLVNYASLNQEMSGYLLSEVVLAAGMLYDHKQQIMVPSFFKLTLSSTSYCYV